MAKLPDNISLPKPRNDWERLLVKTLSDYLNTNSQLVNGISSGRMAANINAASAAPTSGLYAKGDVVPKLTPTNVVGGSAFLQIGWICVSEGSASAASFVDYIVLSDDTRFDTGRTALLDSILRSQTISNTLTPLFDSLLHSIQTSTRSILQDALLRRPLYLVMDAFLDRSAFIVSPMILTDALLESDGIFLALQTGDTYATDTLDDYVVEKGSVAPAPVLALETGDTYATMTGADLAEG